MSDADIQFGLWVTQLGGRVQYLQSSVSRKSVEEASQEANTCKAELSHLYDYARQHSVNVSIYYFALSQTEASLRQIEDDIKEKQKHEQRNLWQEVLHYVGEAIKFVARFFGIDTGRNLLGSEYPRLPGR
jgi:hypothetical protein